jgi:hypothetical protein
MTYKSLYMTMIVVSYLRPEVLNRLEEVEISGIDLSGKGLVQVPSKRLVRRTVEKKIRFPASTPIKNVYRGTSSLVPRVFFSSTPYDNISPVQDEITHRGGKIPIGTISKAIKLLEADLIISREGN